MDVDDRSHVAATVHRLNQAWLHRRFAEMPPLFHEHAVITAPGHALRTEGRAACVQTYVDFLGRAEVTHYEEAPLAVEVWGDTAVASYRWVMGWQAGGREFSEAGRDVLVLQRRGRAWVVVWRTLVPETGA